MTSITINLGDAFLLDTPPNGQHLYIAIAQTSETSYLFVNVTSYRASSEDACILEPGPGVPSFISRKSVIAYRFAREMNATQLAQLITPDSPIPKGSCSAVVLEQIQQGGLVSRRLPNKYKTALRAFLGIP
ncbi:hypothetical protein [Oscillatoria acuminata]|uniref:Uncharacterized protein n=1 Tax=Oscillatoria acuminata PCC 6304 TaxID=56110 RepID=K9TD13_9CYAN|nr:hypothetical protein [Oscillatoria acuminata]AFY79894.1 hypothetical protein Oscil6304_0137 [Oscillatoria acuminata PCC 6304]